MSQVISYTNTLGGPARIEVEDGRIRRIRPIVLREDDPKGWTIQARGKSFTPPRRVTMTALGLQDKDKCYAYDRLLYPLIREDFVETLFIGSTHDYVLFFSNRGRVYRLKCYEIPESSRTARGVNVVNLLPLEPEEKITSMIRVEEFRDDHYLVMVTKNGIIKRTELSAYHTTRKGGVIAISLDEGDDLAWVRLTDGNCEVFVATKNGMIIRFHEQDARPLSRTARGVKAISLEDGDEVVGMARIREGATLLTVTTKGQGRRTRLEDYRVQNRAGKGLTNYHVSEEKGTVAGIKVVDETDDIILITDDGIIIRFAVDQIPIQSRYAGGVRVMRTSENSQVVTLARAEHEEDEEESAESPQEAEGQETEELSKEISPENPSPAQE